MAEQLPLSIPVDPPPFPFKGAAYVSHLDGARLETALGRIIRFMLAAGGSWLTVPEVCASLEEQYPGSRFPQASVSAQLRNARKVGYRVERRRRGEPRLGLFEFALFPPEGDRHE